MRFSSAVEWLISACMFNVMAILYSGKQKKNEVFDSDELYDTSSNGQARYRGDGFLSGQSRRLLRKSSCVR